MEKFTQRFSYKQYKNIWNQFRQNFNILRIALQLNTKEFCLNTSLHALKYLAYNQLKLLEKCFFGISITISVCIAYLLITRVYHKWANMPIIVGINPVSTFVTDEPFPAITICNLNRALNSRVEKIPTNSKEYAMLQLLCHRKVNTSLVETITKWNQLENFMVDIAQPCDDMLMACRYGGEYVNCSHIFYPVVTDEGFCCEFNMLSPKFMYATYKPLRSKRKKPKGVNYEHLNWNAESGYPNKLPTNFTPLMAAGVGESLGLSVALDAQEKQYYCSSSASFGFKLTLHSPNESPSIREAGVLIEPGKETKLRIRMEKTESDSKLRGIDRNIRYCLFQNEYRMKLYRHYTRRNCAVECLAKMLMRHCKCVSYFMPKAFVNTTVCSIYEERCERRVRLDLNSGSKSCLNECLPACYELNFLSDAFSTRLSYDDFNRSIWNVKHSTHNYMENNVALIHIYYKDTSFDSNIKKVVVEFPDFLSSIGGLMGLFLGFSFLSIAEVVYFALIRPCRSLYGLKANTHQSQQQPAKLSFPAGQRYQITRRFDQRWRKRYIKHRQTQLTYVRQKPLTTAGLPTLSLSIEEDPPDDSSPIANTRSKSGTPELEIGFCETCCNSETAKRSLKYYLENTTLHGLQYVADDQITILERVYFGLAFVSVVILSGWFISNIYVKWTASPIIIATSHKLTPTNEIPFPAITICNLNQAMRSKVEDIPKDNSNYSLLMSLCSPESADLMNSSFIGNWKSFKTILIEVTQPCSEMLLYCSYGSQVENCTDIFNSVLTDDGLCCTFNSLDPKYLLRDYNEENQILPPEETEFVAIDWTPEEGYEENLPRRFYPRVSGGVGRKMGLTVILNVSSDEYFCSKSSSIGFKILVHNPAELPKISNYGFLMTAGQEARIPIEPVYQNAAPSIRAIQESIRRCLFSDEGDLVYYRTYSRTNCELECEAKNLLEKCSCITYYLPRSDPAVKICGPSDLVCTQQVRADIGSARKNITCDSCLPGCFELNYQTSLTSTPIVNGSFRSLTEYPQDIFGHNGKVSDVTIVDFYYISSTFRGTTKTEIIGFTEFLSNIGGLLGLFMGFSIFSLIEIVYYVTFRPYCAARTIRKERLMQAKMPKVLSAKKSISIKSTPHLSHSKERITSTRSRRSIKSSLSLKQQKRPYNNNIQNIFTLNQHQKPHLNQFQRIHQEQVNNNNNNTFKYFPYLE